MITEVRLYGIWLICTLAFPGYFQVVGCCLN